jgi:hypothetical protein
VAGEGDVKTDRAPRFFIPEAVYMTDDGGEWLVRKMANGYHVIGPWTVDSYGHWPTLPEAREVIVVYAGDGQWEWFGRAT